MDELWKSLRKERQNTTLFRYNYRQLLVRHPREIEHVLFLYDKPMGQKTYQNRVLALSTRRFSYRKNVSCRQALCHVYTHDRFILCLERP